MKHALSLPPKFRRRQEEARSAEQRNWWLRNAQYMAHFSQVALLLLAAFGYWYTVRPIHQRDLLDEQIAQLTKERNAVDRELKSARELAQAEHKRAQAQQQQFEARLAKQRADAIADQNALVERLSKDRDTLLAEQKAFVHRLEADKQSLRRTYETQLAEATAKTAQAQAETTRIQGLVAYRSRAQSECLRTRFRVSQPTREDLIACMTGGLQLGSTSLSSEDASLAARWIERESAGAMQSIIRPSDEGLDFAWEALHSLAEVRAACFTMPQTKQPFDPSRPASGVINCSDLRAIAEQTAKFMSYYAAVLRAIENVATGVARRGDAAAPPALPNPPTMISVN